MLVYRGHIGQRATKKIVVLCSIINHKGIRVEHEGVDLAFNKRIS
jgi:hypothetical protein